MSEAPRHRFFVDALEDAGGVLELPADVARHARVLRLRVGDAISLFDGRGREALAEICEDDPLRCRVEPPTVAVPDSPQVHLVQALPKGRKIDQIVRMTTELGVDAIHLAVSERTISRPDGKKTGGKISRLLKIAQEASRQSRRRTIPEIHPPRPLADIVADAPRDALRIVFWEDARESLSKEVATPSEVWAVVGPEGGLSHTEVTTLSSHGFEATRIGQTTLRVETAAPAAVVLALGWAGRIRR